MDRELESIAESLRGIREELRELKQTNENLTHIIKLLSVRVPEVEDEVVEPPSGLRGAEVIRTFLASKGIEIVSTDHDSDSRSVDVLDPLARVIGNKYLEVSAFMDRLKTKTSTGEPFSMNLKDEPQSTVTTTCGLASQMHKLALLSEYKYMRSPNYLLKAAPSTSPKAINFINGGWLEDFIRIKFTESFAGLQVPHSYIQGVKIKMPNGDSFELDFLCEIDGDVFWLECKTGDYQRHIGRYSTFKRELGMTRDNTLLVLSDTKVSSGEQEGLAKIFEMNVIKISQVELFMTRLREIQMEKRL